MDHSITTTSSLAILSLSIIRCLVGGSALLFPIRAGSLFGITLNSSSAIMGRLFGARDLILGAVALKARHQFAEAQPEDDMVRKQETLRDLRSILWIGLTLDLMDLGSCVVGILEGGLLEKAQVSIGGGAAGAVLLAIIGLRGLR